MNVRRWAGRPVVLGPGGLGLMGAAGFGLLYGEVKVARRVIPSGGTAPRADGRYGGPAGKPLRLAMLGDSSAAGVGCEAPHETPGAQLATALAGHGYRVDLDVHARSGSKASMLSPQLERCLANPPDVAVISVGANDVAHLVSPADAVPHLADAVRRLRAAGVLVVVATCPDLGIVRPVPQPLRWIGHRLCRRMSREQQRAVRAAGGTPVDVSPLVVGEFAKRANELFSTDRFHPNGDGYRTVYSQLLPAILDVISGGQPSPPETVRDGSPGRAGATGAARSELVNTVTSGPADR